jgi:hypothetical protein
MVSQFTQITADGVPPEDAAKSCVPSSLCAGAMWLNNISQLGGLYTPDTFKDKVYGQNYQGFMAAWRFVDFCKNELGIKLSSLRSDDPAQLVQWAHEHVRAGHPVVFTVPYSPGVTHVCVFFGEETGQLTCMDPLKPQPTIKSDAEWRHLLQDNEIWIMEKLMIDLKDPTVARYFEPKDDKTWRCKQTGKTIYGENLTFYRTCGYSALRGLDDLGLPLSEEIPIERLDPKFQHLAGKVTVKFYELGVTLFDPENKMGGRPGGGRVYKAHLFDGGPGSETFFRLAQHL